MLSTSCCAGVPRAEPGNEVVPDGIASTPGLSCFGKPVDLFSFFPSETLLVFPDLGFLAFVWTLELSRVPAQRTMYQLGRLNTCARPVWRFNGPLSVDAAAELDLLVTDSTACPFSFEPIFLRSCLPSSEFCSLSDPTLYGAGCVKGWV